MRNIFHALGLHMHQPPGNIELLLESNPWEADQIISCYARPVRYINKYKESANINIGFSGILLEQLTDRALQSQMADIYNMEEVLSQYRATKQIEIIGMGYYHPIFPLIPREDWMSQLLLGREKAKEVFGEYPIGFWPSEMAFSIEMIPSLRQAGYEYVIVDDVHIRVENEDPERGRGMSKNISYLPHLAQYNNYEIVIIPRSRDISNAQESGLNPEWFENEVMHKTSSDNVPQLVTTWSDGENGGWFRQMHEESGFWGHFFGPYMERIIEKRTTLKTIRLSDFINDHPPKDYVFVQTGAWNVGQTSGFDFSQWSGSQAQKMAFEEVWSLSKEYHCLDKGLKDRDKAPEGHENVIDMLSQAHNLLLKAETSCYFFWGDAWIPKVYDLTKPARIILKKVAEILA